MKRKTLTFEARLRGYDPADWSKNVPDAGLFLFGHDGAPLGFHYRQSGRWYARDIFGIADDYSRTEETDIGYVLDMSEVVETARERIGTNRDTD